MKTQSLTTPSPPMPIGKAALCLALLSSFAIAGCSANAKFAYQGHEYSTQSSLEYHKKVLAEVQQKYQIDVNNVPRLTEADVSGSADAIASQLPKLRRQVEAFQGAANDIAAAGNGSNDHALRQLLTDEASELLNRVTDAKTQLSLAESTISLRTSESLREEMRRKKEVEDASYRHLISTDEGARKAAAARFHLGAQGEGMAGVKRFESMSAILDECQKQMRPVPCTVDGLTEKGEADCNATCRVRIQSGLNALTEEFAKACASKYFDANKKNKPSCEIKLPDGHSLAASAVTRANAVCLDRCKEKIETAAAHTGNGGDTTAKCRRCFQSTASASDGIEAWCDAKVSQKEWESLIGPSCNAACASKEAYGRCLRR